MYIQHVAPFTGAWIEICKIGFALAGTLVAPFTGAWIEIKFLLLRYRRLIASHPSRVRGLKLLKSLNSHICKTSHPSRVRGLK